ncbi:hypothetical protein ElyMa_001971600 [Elysia marginata]|uniref:FHA domain-containing protein n=1 Tax=Elysia marginata TaxID=1093978 RepID=A0AAV4EZC1_9GAST|nr:hypothetical protein ElyMa_001971600 [Elysia marginata]
MISRAHLIVRDEQQLFSFKGCPIVSSSLDIPTPICTLSRSTPAPLQPGNSKPGHSLMTNQQTECDKAPHLTASISTRRRGSTSASGTGTKRGTEKRVSVARIPNRSGSKGKQPASGDSDTANIKTKEHT